MTRSDDTALAWLRLPSHSDSLARFQAFVRNQAAPLPESLQARIDLVLEEVLLNVFSYAYGAGREGMVALGCGMVSQKAFLVRITDQGKPFNPLQQPCPNLTLEIGDREVGGLGILLARNMSSAMSYRRCEGRNILDIIFQIG